MSSSNIFESVLNDVSGVKDSLLGPTYPYYSNIKSPSQMGLSSDGTLDALGNDLSGLVSYVEILVSGNSNASVTGGPLGNKFFLNTGTKCKDPNGKEQDRYIYVNNVPNGNIPFISSAMGTDFKDAKGLIPGVLSDLNVLNPYSIMQAFLSGSEPPCQMVTLQTIDNNNAISSASHYVSMIDLQNMDPCNFSGGKNPYSNKNCSESFANVENRNTNMNMNTDMNLPEDPFIQLFFICLAILGIYMLVRISVKGMSR